jgi:hypothetical protein
MRVYKYAQSHVAILQRHVSATPAAIISVSYNKYIINTQTIVQTCVIKLLGITLGVSVAFLMVIKYKIIIHFFLLFSLPLQPSVGHGFLVHEVS